jgi:hypothetical protein
VTLTIGALTHDKEWLLVGIFRFAMKRVLLEAIREKTEKDLLCLHAGIDMPEAQCTGHFTYPLLVCGIDEDMVSWKWTSYS